MSDRVVTISDEAAEAAIELLSTMRASYPEHQDVSRWELAIFALSHPDRSIPRLHSIVMMRARLRRFGISIKWLEDEAQAGRIPSLRIRAGKRDRFVFDPEAVETALLRRAAGATQQESGK